MGVVSYGVSSSSGLSSHLYFFSYCPFFPYPVFCSFDGILMGPFFSICLVFGTLNVIVDGWLWYWV